MPGPLVTLPLPCALCSSHGSCLEMFFSSISKVFPENRLGIVRCGRCTVVPTSGSRGPMEKEDNLWTHQRQLGWGHLALQIGTFSGAPWSWRGGPLLDCPSLDTGSLSFLAPLAPRSALEELSPPWVFVAHVLLAVHSCDLALLFPLSGPQFPFPPNTVKAFPALTCCDWVWKPAPPEGWAPPPVPSPCPAQGWHDVRAHSTLIDSERSSRQRP